MKKLKFYLIKIYRLALNFKKQEEIVWNDLKKLHADSEWLSGVYEKEKNIESIFNLSEGKTGKFYYMIYDGSYHCRVKILEEFSVDLTTELFILAAHFNNLLTNGVVKVNIKNQYVEYHQKRDLLIPLLYIDEIYHQLNNHFLRSKDIYSAFKRLIEEQEAPAIIIADFLKENEKDDEDAK